MIINKEINGSSAVLKPEGWLDTPNSAEFKEALDGLGSEITELTIDMEKLEYISSAGLRVLLIAHKEMAKKSGLVLRGLNQNVLSILKLTGFDKTLNIV